MRTSNKKRTALIQLIGLIFAVLPFFLYFSLATDYYTGIGASDYPYDKVIYVNNSFSVDIARLTNIGTLNFTVKPVWIPDNNPSCTVELPTNFMLVVGESKTITCNVFSSTVGNFSGKVEFICDVNLPANFTGNPSVPGHTTKVNFIFKEPIKQAYMPYDYKPILIIGSIMGISATAILTFLHIRKKHPSQAQITNVNVNISNLKTDKRTSRKEYMRNYMREKRRKQREAKSQS